MCTLRSPSPSLASDAECQMSVHFSEERISTAFVGFLDSLYLLAPKCVKKNRLTAGTHCCVHLVSIPPPGGREPLQPPPHWEAGPIFSLEVCCLHREGRSPSVSLTRFPMPQAGVLTHAYSHLLLEGHPTQPP